MHSTPGEGAATILIVDDDPINVSILQDLLHSVGYLTLVGGGWLAPVQLVGKQTDRRQLHLSRCCGRFYCASGQLGVCFNSSHPLLPPH